VEVTVKKLRKPAIVYILCITRNWIPTVFWNSMKECTEYSVLRFTLNLYKVSLFYSSNVAVDNLHSPYNGSILRMQILKNNIGLSKP